MLKSYALFSAEPPEKEDFEDEEPVVAQLPDYNLPQKRQKTNLQKFNQPDIKVGQKPGSSREELPVGWDKLPSKPFEVQDETMSLMMGIGSKPGTKFFLY